MSKETIPFVNAAIESHFAATHVGGVLDGSHVPAESHASDGAPISECPSAHVNETSLPAAVVTEPASAGLTVRCGAGDGIVSAVHVTAVTGEHSVVTAVHVPAAVHVETSTTPAPRA